MGFPLHLDVAKRQGSVNRRFEASVRRSTVQAVSVEELPS